MHIRRISAIVAALALSVLGAGCATAPPSGNAAEAPAAAPAGKVDYRDYIRGSAWMFDGRHISDWDSPDPSQVVVWTAPTRAWLLTLTRPCFALQTTATIGLTSQATIKAGSDAVIAGGERCPILRIDQLDARRLKADLGR